MPSIHHHPSSYRDPSGFIFIKDGVLYRQVNRVYQPGYEQLISSGLYDHLVKKNMLIPHQEIHENLTASTHWFLTLKPEYLPFTSWPYEWSFDMLKDAALLTLDIAVEAINRNMVLKDASAYNVQMYKGSMIFIDSLSFEIYNEQEPWIAYRQFCEHFYAPLALMHYLKKPLNQLLMAWPDGIPLQTAAAMPPWKSRLHLHTSLNLHFHASAIHSRKKAKEVSRPFSRTKMLNLLRSLREGISGFRFEEPTGVWSGYYKEASTRADYLENKKNIISNWIREFEWKTAFDAGANEGAFTLLLKDQASLVVSADMDHFSINELYKKIRRENIANIHPLVMDLSSPSPSIGVNNMERESFLGRIKTDLVLALALIHHLCIGRNIPFEMVAEMFSRAGSYLVIEFVPPEDEKALEMFKYKKEAGLKYNEQEFRQSFEKYFQILSTQHVQGSVRTLYLMKSHEI